MGEIKNELMLQIARGFLKEFQSRAYSIETIAKRCRLPVKTISGISNGCHGSLTQHTFQRILGGYCLEICRQYSCNRSENQLRRFSKRYAYWARVIEEAKHRKDPDFPCFLISREKSFMADSLIDITPLKSQHTKARYYFQGEHAHAYLTHREREVLCFIAKGYTNKKTALLLGLSPRTVECYLKNMRDKLKVCSTPTLVGFALRDGVIEP